MSDESFRSRVLKLLQAFPLLALLTALPALGAAASDPALTPASAAAATSVSPDSAAARTDARADESAPASDSLLPALMGPMETVFWGRHGMMRGLGFPLTEASREEELSLRRTMLTLHEIGGFTTLASMTATVVVGQMIVNGRTDVNRLKDHLAWTTVGLYSTTALLALLTPPPVVRRKEFSSLTLHKAFAVVHFTGMLVEPVLGYTFKHDPTPQVLRYHQILGYTTLAALAGAMIVITF